MRATRVEAAIERVAVSAYTIPTDAPESDGTLEWDSTTIVVVEVAAGGETGLGYTYGRRRRRARWSTRSSRRPPGSDALATGASHRRRCARRCETRAARASGRWRIAAVDVALWDLKARLARRAARRRCSARARDAVPRLRQRRVHVVLATSGSPSSSAAGSTDGHPAREDEDRPRAASATRRGSTPRATRSATRELFVDANGAYDREQALALGRPARRAGT